MKIKNLLACLMVCIVLFAAWISIPLAVYIILFSLILFLLWDLRRD